jgi:SAM-dependent methyltransferase
MRVRDFSMVAALGVALIAGSAYAGQSSAGAPQTSRAAMAAHLLAAATRSQAPATKLRDPDVIYVPTPQNVVDAMLKIANVTAKDVVYDLGSGDGRIPITAAEKYGARGVGIDINPERIKEANANLAKSKAGDKVRFLNQDLFETDLSPATVITLYLLPSLNQKLIPKLKQLKPGTRIVSHSFDMGTDWPPEKTEDVQGRMVYYWTIK